MASDQEITGTLEIMAGMFQSFRPTEMAIQQWCRMLKDVPHSEILSALDHFTKTNPGPHAPTISQIFQALRDINPARVPKFEGHLKQSPTKPLASPELLRKQMLAAREKYPHLFDGRQVPELPDGKAAIAMLFGGISHERKATNDGFRGRRDLGLAQKPGRSNAGGGSRQGAC